MKVPLNDFYAKLSVTKFLDCHTEIYLKNKDNKKARLYVDLLERNYKAFEFSSREIVLIAHNAAGVQLREESDWPMSKFLVLTTLEERREIVKFLQNSYQSNLPNETLVDIWDYRYEGPGPAIRGRVIYTDNYFRANTDYHDSIALYADGSFLNSECPVCMEEFLFKCFIHEVPCRHAIHIHCAVTWFKRRNVCPLCLHSVPCPISINVEIDAYHSSDEEESAVDIYVEFRHRAD